MRAKLSLVTCFAAILATVAVSQAQERHAHRPGADASRLGTVAFANSGADAAQAPFLRGLALLHSFEYDEAAEAFRAAQTADPGFAMAFWGEAVTYSHLLWGEDDVEAARRVLNRLAPSRDARLARAKTAREQAYGAAVEALFADGDLSMRVRGFADAMRAVTARYPDDIDAAAFTSLALMFAANVGQLPPDQRRVARDDAITFAQRVFAAEPSHPGGVHYLIHATDDPEMAPRGLEAARRYAEIAPEAEHALHMPSHIFVQLGLWSDAVASDERAFAASRAEVAARKLSNADLSFHSLQWLQYAYLQSGRYRASRGTIDTAREVLAGVDLSVPTYTDARYTIGWLTFQHAAIDGRLVRGGLRPSERGEAAANRGVGSRTVVHHDGVVSGGDRRGDVRSRGDRDRGLAEAGCRAAGRPQSAQGGAAPCGALDLHRRQAAGESRHAACRSAFAIARAGRAACDAAHRGAAGAGAFEGRPAARGHRRVRAGAAAHTQSQQRTARSRACAPRRR